MASEVAESFQASLDELKFNSKPQISMLTMLAEDNEQYASEIVQVIEEQIKKVSVARKLPILYLVDSIMKNLPKTIYPHLFEQCIVQIFCGVFEEVDEKTRQSMYKLRQTWVDIIQNKRLYALDVGVRHIDPAWPVTASPPEQGVIHVNPKFLKGTKESSSQLQTMKKPYDDISDELHAKERELQKAQLQQELEQSKKRQLEKQQLEILNARPGRKVIDREPPPLIALPPAVTSSSTDSSSAISAKSRGPPLSRDPRLNRDPRLRKQLETRENDIDNSITTPMTSVKSSAMADDTRVAEPSKHQTGLQDQALMTRRLDLESLLNSFSKAVTKVAAVQQANKNIPQTFGNESSQISASLNKASHISETHKSSQSSIQKSPPDHSGKSSDAHNNKRIGSHSSHKSRQGSPQKKIKLSPPLDDKVSNTSSSSDQKSSSNSVRKDSRIGPKALQKSPSSEKTQRDPREGKNSSKESNKDAKSPDKNEKGGKSTGTLKSFKNRGSEKDPRGTSLSPRKDKNSDRNRPNERSRGRNDANNDKRNPRGHFHSSPDKRGDPRERNWDKKHNVDPVIHSPDGEADQSGHMLHKSDSKDAHRDRSPLTKDQENSKSPRGRDQKLEKKEDDSSKDNNEINSPLTETDILPDDSEVKNALTPQSPVENKSPPPEPATQDLVPTQELQESEAEIQDVDMRIAPPVREIAPTKNVADQSVKEQTQNLTTTEAEVNAHKRSKSESDSANVEDAPSEKRPKIDKEASLKQEAKPAVEDISQLFGEEDVDYRNINKGPSRMIPPPIPSETLLSPTTSKSPAERRWSQFKESHPDDFAQETERKRLRSVQMQEMQDVDMRQQLVSPRQRSLPLPPVLEPLEDAPRPKERSVENRDLILQRADKELKEGRMSPGNHRELVRQVEEVYEMPRGRPDIQRPVKNIDLRDPRLRGSHEQGAESDDIHDLGRPRSKDGKPPPPLSVPSGDLRNGPHPMDRKIPPHLPKSSRQDERNIGNHSPVYQERDEDLRRGGYRREFEPQNPNRDLRGRYRNVSQDYDERSPRDFDYDEDHPPRDFDDRRPNQFRDFDRRPRRKFDADDKGPYYEENDQRHYERGRFHEPPYVPRRPGRHDIDDVHHGPRRTSPPVDRSRPADFENRRGRDIPPSVDMRGHRGSFEGPDGPPKRHDERPQGRIPSPDHPPFVNKAEGPPRPLPGPAPNPPSRGLPPHPPRRRASPSGEPAISDPLEDPRWAPMRGLLDSDGTEEVVLDDKPFELRMGTSRKLRMYGQVFEVAVDMKERGIRVDGQLVYKLGEPIKEVPIRGRMIRLYYHGHPKPIWLDGQQHEMRIDAPPRNVMVDGAQRGFQIDGRDMMILVDRLEKGPYGGPPRKIRILGIEHDIGFQFPSRQILIDGKPCELKLDSKIPFVIIEGKPHGIRFDGEPKTIFINNQPYVIPLDRAERVRIGPRPTYIAFGGPAHELIIDGKWFEVKFDNMLKDIHLGNRHFSIRIPGPLPRVKILDQMPSNFDVSGLMMTHKIPQSGPPRGPVPQNAQDQTIKVSNETAIGNKDISSRNTDTNPIQPKEEPSSSVSPIQPQPAQPDTNNILPGMKSDGGNQAQGQNNMPQPPHLPGPLPPNRLPGFGQMNQQPRGMMGPGNRGMMPQGPGLLPPQGIGMMPQGMIPPGLLNPGMMQPGAGMMQQPGANFMQNLMRPPLGGNPMLQQLGLRGPMPNLMAMQTNAGLLSQPQPVNLIAQGLLSQVANSMQFAAGIQALSQMSNQNKPESKHLPGPPIVTTANDHSAAMATGLQGTSSLSQNKNPEIVAPNVPPLPSSLLPHLPGLPANLASSGNPLTAPPPHMTTPSTTSANSTSLPTSLSSQLGASSTAALVSQVTKPSLPTTSSLPNDSKSDGMSVSTTIKSSTEDAASKAPIDINNLLSSLLKAGLIKDSSKSEEKPMENETDAVKDASKEPSSMTQEKVNNGVPDMTDFSLDELKIYHNSVVDALHEGIQCHTCSARFTEDDQEKYRAHLDWHFRQNKIEQEMVKVAKNRKWFYTITDWIQYEELEDAEEKFRSEIFEQMKAGFERAVVVDQMRMRGLEGKDFIKNPIASGVEGEDVCATCGDPFDQMWNEETEEWILKNTIKVDGKTYHPVCYEDLHETPSSSVVEDNKNPFDVAAANALLSCKEEDMKTEENPVSEENKTNLTETETKNQTECTDSHADSSLTTVSTGVDEIKTEIKEEVIEPVSTSLITEPSSVSIKQEPGVTPTVCHAPNLLSTIASTIKREVIRINQEDPSSPWEMDSNPTPELSRTPTPEPIPSFTPVPSQSSDSVTSSVMTDIPGIEDPIPSSCSTEARDTLNEKSTTANSVSASIQPDSPLDAQKMDKGS